MQHLSTESLAALALGEPDVSADHLATCARCRAEVASLRGTADRFRAAAVAPIAPPAAVWDRIAADIAAVEAAPAPTTAAASSADAEPSSTRSRDVARRRRRFSGRALIAACAASAVAAASLAVLLVTQLGGSAPSIDVADAVLEPLGSSVSPARAEVVERDGQRLLVVDADALPAVDGYLDVWLLDADAQQMVNLGVMDAASTELALPAELDLAAFPVVDVSVEPYDGDPTHSGDSIWRGALEL